MGYINFTAGDVLTAADCDTLMRQGIMVFAAAANRDSDLTGVLTEGMHAYLTSENRLTYYTGSAWVPVWSLWEDYTPGLTNGAVGNGTLEFRYRYTGPRTIRVRGKFTLGSTSTITGLLEFALPDSVTADASPRSLGTAWLLDDSTTNDVIGSCWADSGIKVYSTAVAPTSSTVPFTWTTSDSVNVDIEFEIA